jgi:predicted amidophosphoribosyltransferase
MNLPVHVAPARADHNHHDKKNDVRCLLCQRLDPPHERAVAYGSYEGELRDLIHRLKFQQVRRAAAPRGRVLAGTISDRISVSGQEFSVNPPNGTVNRELRTGN